MVYVVDKETDTILQRADAWELDAPERLAYWAASNGYTVLKHEITPMGDMVIWVQKAA